MKKTITKTIAVILAIIAFSFTPSKQTTDYGLARVKKISNKLCFYYNEPINEYEIAFTFVNSIPDFNCKTPQEILSNTIKNANIEGANQSRMYDAIIIGHAERDMAITWKDKSKDNAIARVEKIEGKYVFIECEPNVNYDIIGKYDVSGVGQQLLLGSCPTHKEKIEKLLKKSTKDKLAFDAVIYGSNEKDLSIKFK